MGTTLLGLGLRSTAFCGAVTAISSWTTLFLHRSFSKNIATFTPGQFVSLGELSVSLSPRKFVVPALSSPPRRPVLYRNPSPPPRLPRPLTLFRSTSSVCATLYQHQPRLASCIAFICVVSRTLVPDAATRARSRLRSRWALPRGHHDFERASISALLSSSWRS